MFVAFLMAFLLRWRFSVLNRRREIQLVMLPQDVKQVGDAIATTQEVPDTDLRYRYMT